MHTARVLAITALLLAPAGAASASAPADLRLAQAVQGRTPTGLVAYLDVRDADGKAVTVLDATAVSGTLGGQALTVGRVVPVRDAGEGVAFIFCVDISRSLSAADFAEVRAAVGRWVDGMAPLDRAAVLSFGSESKQVVDFTADKAALRAALDALGPTDMQTVLYRGLRQALELSSRRDPDVPGRRVVVVLSDGKDEGSGLAAEDVMVSIREHGLPLYAIGFGGARRQESLDLLLRFATNSGGDFVAVGRGSIETSYAAMREAIDRVWMVELDCPSCVADGSARRLQLNLRLADRVLSEGVDLRLLPPLDGVVAAAPAAAAPAVAAPAAVAAAESGGDGASGSRQRWLWIFGIGAAVVVLAAALAARRARASSATAETDGAAASPRRRRRQQGLTKRERKQLDVPLDSEPLIAPVALCLTVVRGVSEGSEHRFLLHRRAVLGSGAKSDFVVSEPDLAVEQVELVQQDSGVYARNLSRSQPTLVNGAPLLESKPLANGDLLGNRGFIARVRLGLTVVRNKGGSLSAQTFELSDFASIVETPGQPRTWFPAQFPAPEGGMWVYQEPDAVIVVQDGRLRVAAVPFTRSHDRVQVLDNAKHMYFSTKSFEAPAGGRLAVEWEMAASISRGRPGDLYDGFVSFHLLNPMGGVAVDIFLGNEELATVYARLPFPGSNAPRPAQGPRFYSVFDEMRGKTKPGEIHAYAMIHDRGTRTLEWRMDGETLKRLDQVEDLGPCHVVMGLMTEKDIVPGQGSVSCHGQGAVGTWGRIRVTLEEKSAAGERERAGDAAAAASSGGREKA